MSRPFLSILFVCVLLAIVGCASFGEKHLRVRSDFEQGKIEKARTEIQSQLKKKWQRESDLLKLNQSIIELCSGNSRQSEKLLREVRDSFDQIERQRLAKHSEKALSMLTDDNTVAYEGEDYEKVLIRVFLALSNLMHGGDDAQAYALQIGQKQNEIIGQGKTKKPSEDDKEINLKSSYRQVAIGPYLIGLLREETHRDYDDAARAYQAVSLWEPQFSQGIKDLNRARHGVHSAPNNGVVYVFGLVGGGPYKIQRNSEVTQEALFWTSFFLSFVGKHTVTPGVAPVMVPVVVRPREVVPSLVVSVDGKRSGETETITDIGRMAEEQFEAIYPQIIARAVLRRALKKGILYGAKEASDANPWVGLAMDLGGIVWEAMETADTRCWNLLPAEIQVVRLELPTGVHHLTLQPSSRVFSLSNNAYLASKDSMPVGTEHSRTIRVDAGRNTYVLANFQNANLIGQIIVSNESQSESMEIAP